MKVASNDVSFDILEFRGFQKKYIRKNGGKTSCGILLGGGGSEKSGGRSPGAISVGHSGLEMNN